MDSLRMNPLSGKADFEKALKDVCEPVIPYLSEGKALLKLPSPTITMYHDLSIGVEAFARMLWGLAPYAKGKSGDALLELFKQGLLNGTDPSHPEYWGDLQDYDQRAVEMPPIALFLYFSKADFWDRLNAEEKSRIEQWLLQCNQKEAVENNWLFFRVIVNILLKQLGATYSEEAIEKNLARIEEFYVGDGWYTDGKTQQRDYYISFALHYYSLIYAKVMEKDDPKRSRLYKERAARFAQDFIHWFSEDGSAIPFGRSLTYRFAQVSFWSAILFADVEVFTPGIIKGLIARHIKWWAEQPIFNPSGLLTVGYTYPNTIMAEEYNGTGSPYWAFKAFLILALEENHPFWQVEAEPLPELAPRSFQEKARMVVTKKGAHVAAFVNGQQCGNLLHSVSKYEKYVYSNMFGFSVSRSAYGLTHGAYDSTLAVSEDGEIYKARHGLAEVSNQEDVLYSKWHPWKDVEIEAYLLPGLPWHVRVYRVKTDRAITLQDGGFSINRQSYLHPPIERKATKDENGAYVSYQDHHSGIQSLLGGGNPDIIFPTPNTNLLYPRTELPVLIWNLEKGEHILASAVLGDTECARDEGDVKSDIPELQQKGRSIVISFEEKEITIDFE